jgi:hypothetical protein
MDLLPSFRQHPVIVTLKKMHITGVIISCVAVLF